MSHTPGPWRAWTHTEGQWFVDKVSVVPLDLNNQIATMDGFNSASDARLIAAAPDLLQVCEEALHWITYNNGHLFEIAKGSSGDKLVEALETILTKARYG